MRTEFYRIRIGYTNTYLLPAGEGWILVDTGMKGRSGRFFHKIARLGISPESIKLIIITHNHFDHVGNLRAIRERTGARVLVHDSDADLIESGTVHYPRGTNRVADAISSLGNRRFLWWGAFEAAPADIRIREETDLGTFGADGRIIPAPGHTSGSLCVRLDSGLAFVGDCLASFPFSPGIYPPFADDPSELLKTWEKMLGWGCSWYYPAHGGRVSFARLKKAHRALTARG